MKTAQFKKLVLVSAVSAMLAACGGGGGGSTPAAVTSPTPTPIVCNAPQFMMNGVCTSPLTKTVADLTMKCETDKQNSTLMGFDAQISADWDAWVNDANGAGGITGFTLCTGLAALSPTKAIGRWTWDFGANSANDGGYVKGYTALGQGHQMGWPDHSPTFGKIISSFSELNVTWDTEVTHAKSPKFVPPANQPNAKGEGGDLLLEIYISTDGNPTSGQTAKSTSKLEVSFNLIRWGNMDFVVAGEVPVVIDGVTYRFNVRPNPPYAPQATFTVVGGWKPTGTMNLIKVLEWLKSQNYITNSDWIDSIYLGTEYTDGVGEAKVNSFELTFK